nr:MAG TPA: hypothetical protein [Caudoviricetes sp.]
MSAESDFEDAVRICEFYADPCETFEVDLENCIVLMGAREVSLVRRGGKLVGYFIIEPDGVSHLEDDLDSYFQGVFDWEDRS